MIYSIINRLIILYSERILLALPFCSWFCLWCLLLNQDCEKALKLTIPALRVAASESLSEKYGMSETDIAKRLGVAQAAVSKYLSRNYSDKIKRVVAIIKSRRLHKEIVKAVLADKSTKQVAELMDRIASEKRLVDLTLKQL